MKKVALSTVFLLVSMSSITAYSAVEQSFAEQLNEQKGQLRPQEFNFFSDRYKQVKAQDKTVNDESAEDEGGKATFKDQLDSQTKLLRDYNFYPIVSLQSQSATY